MASRITHKRIDKYILIKTFKRFKRQPKKVFLVTDFTKAHQNIFRSQCLYTLIVLGLIEQVPATYKCGPKYKIRREVKGYKLK